MKKFFMVLILLLAVLFLSACTNQPTQAPESDSESEEVEMQSLILPQGSEEDTADEPEAAAEPEETVDAEPEETFFIGLSFNEGEKLTNKVTTAYLTTDGPVELVTTVETTVLEVTDEYAVMRGVIIGAVQRTNSGEQDLIAQLTEEQKQSEYDFYFNGAVDSGDGLETNYYFPKEELALRNKYDFGGLTYTLTEKTSADLAENALKISFIGVREGGSSRVTGHILFDYENGKILKTVSRGGMTITNELIALE